jgi:DNA-binding CsgD family transcriptional regulator/PAS domain-containing protein
MAAPRFGRRAERGKETPMAYDRADDVAELRAEETQRVSDLPLAVWEIPSGTIVLVTKAFERLLGFPADQVLGRKIQDFKELLADPSGRALEAVVAAFETGAVDLARVKRRVQLPGGATEDIWIWSRGGRLGGRPVGISLVTPVSAQGRLGRDPSSHGRDLTRVGLGVASHDWVIETVCADAAELTGFTASALVGRPLTDLLKFDAVFPPRSRQWIDVPARGSLRRADGSTVPVGFLYAPLPDDPEGRLVFAILVAAELLDAGNASDARVRDLETRLRRIGSEVRAAGILDDVGALPAMVKLPTLSDLTSRQWEILSRILRGERVPTIARTLYLSQSTVRNHLSAIFKKFGVHSQPELIELLRRTSI